jgi:hypothetical protein
MTRSCDYSYSWDSRQCWTINFRACIRIHHAWSRRNYQSLGTIVMKQVSKIWLTATCQQPRPNCFSFVADVGIAKQSYLVSIFHFSLHFLRTVISIGCHPLQSRARTDFILRSLWPYGSFRWGGLQPEMCNRGLWKITLKIPRRWPMFTL